VAGIAGTLWSVLLLAAPTLPTPAKPLHCAVDCPSNPFALVHLSDGAVDVVERAAVGLYALSACVLVVVLAVRFAAASAAERRILLPPALALWIVAASFVLVPFVGQDVDGVSGLVGWLPAVFSIAFPVALLLGQAQGRLFAAASLRDMVGRLSASPAPRNLEALMADALGDPSLRLAFPLGQHGFVDGGGAAIAPAETQSVAEVRDEHGVVALILHDRALEEAWPGVVGAAGAAVLLALENARLEADLRASARALQSSRARMLTAAVTERRELERDLHDTAQQRLVALQIKLGLARERTEAGDLGPLLDRLSADVEATIDSVRDVGRGLYPPLLADRGLGAALSARSQTSPTARLALAVGELGRADPDLEAAVYVCCRGVLELLTAPGAPPAGLTVGVSGGELLIGVACEAPGGDTMNGDGDGGLRDRTLTRMRDHVVTLGGWADVATPAAAQGNGGAWALSAGVPWPQRAAP
jgi:signal transduction histidine kinase